MAFKYSTAEAVYPIILGCVCGIVFFANLGSTPFYDKGERFQLLAWDTDVLLEKLKRTDDYIIVGEKESKTVTAYSSLSFTPLLRSEGTGPDRDNPLLLVRGAKS
jgi:hypothetical protein